MKNKLIYILIFLTIIVSISIKLYFLNPTIFKNVAYITILIVLAISVLYLRFKIGQEEWDEQFEVHDNKIEVHYSEIFDTKREESIKRVLAVGKVVKPINSTNVRVLSFKDDEKVEGRLTLKKYVATVEYVKELNAIEKNNSIYIEKQFNAGRDINVAKGNINTNNKNQSIDQSQIVEINEFVESHNELSDIEKEALRYLLDKVKEDKVTDIDNKSLYIKVLKKVQQFCNDNPSVFNIASIIISILSS